MSTFFLHVGYPKTATSTLQSELFRKHRQVYNFRSKLEEADKIKKWICGSRCFYPHCYSKLVINKIRNISNKTGIYSEEVFTGNLARRAPDGIDHSTVAKRLAEVFGSIEEISTEVILVIREQRSFLLSAFTFWYHNYKSMGYEKIDELVESGVKRDDEIAYETLSWIRYSDTIEAYNKYFGRGNVHVLFYEDLVGSGKSFVRHLSRIMGINVGESERLIDSSTDRNVTKTDGVRRAPSKVYHWLSIFKSRYLSRIGSVRNFPIGQWVVNWLKSGSKVSLSESSISRLRNFYGKDNRKIEDKFNIEVSKHGYLIS